MDFFKHQFNEGKVDQLSEKVREVKQTWGNQAETPRRFFKQPKYHVACFKDGIVKTG